MITELRDYQKDTIQALRQTIGQGIYRIVVQSPCGSGKTKIAAAIIDSALSKGNRVAFVVDSIDLIDQTLMSLYDEGVRDVGIIQGNNERTDWSRPVQLCSIQTIKNRTAFPEAKTVIFDECHVIHAAHRKWLGHPDWQKIPFIGLSASPWTRGMGLLYNTLLISSTTQELIDRGYLSPFRVFASGHPDLRDVKIVAGDYQKDDLSKAMQSGTLTADIVKTWKEKWGLNKTLAYGVDRAHSQAIMQRFIEAGVTCGYQDAHTPADERREIKRKFHNGEYQVVSNVATLTKGVDWDCRCLLLCRPTRSEMLFVQILGRSLRTAPGKESALILDFSDNHTRMGFITDISYDSLDDGKPKPKAERKAPLPEECKQCSALLAPGVKICPSCGYERKPAISGIIEDDGELQEIKPGLLPKKKRGEKREYTMEEKAQFYAELKGYAAEKNYKEGFAAMKYKERFGVWPNHPSVKYVASRAPSIVTRSWLRSRQIAFVKSKKYAEQQASK
jgi:DNA repair protein RadD